jgi:hypothetical protein
VRGRGAVLSSLLAAVSTIALSAGTALAAGDAASRSTDEPAVKALMAKIQSMEERIDNLQTQLKDAKAKGPKAPGVGESASLASRLPANTVALAPKETKTDGSKASDITQSGSPASRLAMAFADSKDDIAPPRFLPAADLKAPPPSSKDNKDLFGVASSPVPGLKIGMYGEIKFGTQQNPNANGQWQNGFDMGRLVLLPTYQVTDNIVFNAEIEFEHAGSGFDNDDKLHGTAEIEQAYFDIKFNDYFTLRSPGVDIVPISFNNLYHEPTLFYSVQRPELANGLIPTTWVAPSAGFYGKIVDGLNYQVQFSQSAEDFGDDFDHRGADGAPIPGGYAAGVDGLNALGFSHSPLGNFAQLSNQVAVTGRLSYTPSFIPGFAGSTAAYYSPNITPRGAYGDDGHALGSNSLLIIDTEARYRVPNTGLELRAEYAHVTFGNPDNLRANNDTDPTNNVGKNMWGYSGEIAYHFPLGNILNSNWEAVPFYRYTHQNLQTASLFGTDANLPTGHGEQTFHDFGIAVFPNPSLVFKLDYTKIVDNSPTGAQSDMVLGGVGWLW